jgi:hypothetical protein
MGHMEIKKKERMNRNWHWQASGPQEWASVRSNGDKRLQYIHMSWLVEHRFNLERKGYSRVQLPRGLRHETSSPAETLGSWV